MRKFGEVLLLTGLMADSVQAKRALLQRFVMAICSDNGDMHTKNVALHEVRDAILKSYTIHSRAVRTEFKQALIVI